MRLQDKITVITGGGSGIGRTASLKFAAEGAVVILLERNAEAGRKTEADVIAAGGRALFLQTDVSDYDSVRAAFDVIARRFGRVDVLYNNASVYIGDKEGPVADLDVDVWKTVIGINLGGVFYCSKCAIPLMKAHGGSIINTSSSAGVTGVPNCTAYTAAKGGTISLTRSMAVEYGPYNIRTNCIAPAAILTDMVKESNLNDPNFHEDRFLREITPLGRWGQPQDIANIACFLASDEASYINGAVIRADGGITVNGTVNA